MPGARESGRRADQCDAERAIVLQVLRDDRDERWSRVELESEIYDVEPLAISDALETLCQESVVHLSGELVWASRCARRLKCWEWFRYERRSSLCRGGAALAS